MITADMEHAVTYVFIEIFDVRGYRF